MTDMAWGDPILDDEPGQGWAMRPSGLGWCFGALVTSKFNRINNLELIVRSKGLVMTGYTYEHDQQLLKIFSCPNFCYRVGNEAAVVHIGADLGCR
eukprot:CAMPEP_0185593922 /NCGR_PEP_ID=MMETSP0434-20130131/73091_1 /TAXON_ID=626734 ORGANISM="Favella taraikaensis, Strain Fe Narragansett Bay" /NCGR_SAMPLE_ID=MMETSP0434 /ASSEMBLY_ACC=CAM_ASM_000379 /LENGTH=95 /DNA_ID=CAMNT_0028220877 /DNA_START=305 /DNA_END=589 /DNA_ORIENTATION=+